MAEVPRQPRNFKDRALIWISGLLAGGHVPLVADSPRLVRAIDRQLFVMAPSEQETDRTFLAEDGSIWSFEFQFRDGEDDAARMAVYHLTLLRQHPGRRVATVIYWGHRLPPARPLVLQQVTFHPRQVFLRDLLGEDELARWRLRAEDGPLGREAALELAMLPLMQHMPGMRNLLEAALPLTEHLEPDLRAPTRAAMICLGYGELQSPTDRSWAREELLGVPVVGQELFEDLIHDGELREARVALLDAFTARFEDPPAAIREAAAKTSDLDMLRQWLRAVVRAPDAASATTAVLGNH